MRQEKGRQLWFLFPTSLLTFRSSARIHTTRIFHPPQADFPATGSHYEGEMRMGKFHGKRRSPLHHSPHTLSLSQHPLGTTQKRRNSLSPHNTPQHARPQARESTSMAAARASMTASGPGARRTAAASASTATAAATWAAFLVRSFFGVGVCENLSPPHPSAVRAFRFGSGAICFRVAQFAQRLIPHPRTYTLRNQTERRTGTASCSTATETR